jgi:hypothetical protein
MNKIKVVIVIVFLTSFGLIATETKNETKVNSFSNQSDSQNFNFVALLGQQFDGEIPSEEFSNLKKIDLFPSSEGTITSFRVRFYYKQRLITLSCDGEYFNEKLNGYIKELCASAKNQKTPIRIYFHDIEAQIQNKIINMNSISVDIAPHKSNRKITKNFCYSVWKESSTAISRNNIDQVSPPQGNFKGQLLPFNSCTLEYTKSARPFKIKIRNEKEFENFLSTYRPNPHDEIHITNALYKNQNKLIRGTQIKLEFLD